MLGLNMKSNESIIYSFLGWNKCKESILAYEDCLHTGSIKRKEPTKCYDDAKILQLCYAQQANKIEPLCLPIFNDVRECLFQGDSHIISCKEEINELVYCQNNPQDYMQFLKHSTPQQKLAKSYNFVTHTSGGDLN